MPAYNFNKQFKYKILGFTKRQTIRPKRKRRTKAGDNLYLYVGQRTKHCEKLLECICTEVKDISIYENGVSINRVMINVKELEQLAKDDGFNHMGEFIEWFESYYGFPFDGEIIKW